MIGASRDFESFFIVDISKVKFFGRDKFGLLTYTESESEWGKKYENAIILLKEEITEYVFFFFSGSTINLACNVRETQRLIIPHHLPANEICILNAEDWLIEWNGTDKAIVPRCRGGGVEIISLDYGAGVLVSVGDKIISSFNWMGI